MDETPDKVSPPTSPPNEELAPTDAQALAIKIARLSEERGWNQEEFARRAGLNRQTIRTILRAEDRNLRTATISACARALDLSVNELRSQPLEQLLARLQGGVSAQLKHRLDGATQPELIAWRDRNPERARAMSADEADELLSLQQESGGPLASFGVEHFVAVIERKRRLIQMVHAIAGTEKMNLLEELVTLIYNAVQPYPDRQ